MRSVLAWDWYRDPRVLEVEERRLFRPSWQYVGPLECLQRPGDQVVGRVSRVPVRGGAGRRRRTARLPQRVPAPGQPGRPGRRERAAAALPLPRLDLQPRRDAAVGAAVRPGDRGRASGAWAWCRCGSRRSGRSCSPAPAADGPPLDEVIGDLSEVVAGVGLDLGGLRRRQRFDYTLAANWKIHLENYLECYHCPVAHPGFSAVMEVGPGRYELTAATHRLSHRAPVRGAAAFTAGSVIAGSYHLLLPNVKININPGRQNLSIGPVYPDGVDRTCGVPRLLLRRRRRRGVDRADDGLRRRGRRPGRRPGGRRPGRAWRGAGSTGAGSCRRSGCSPTSSATCTPPAPMRSRRALG